MNYINTETAEYPVSLSAIRAEFPNTAFPKQPTDKELISFNYALVNSTDKPVDELTYTEPDILPDGYQPPVLYDGATQKVEEGVPTPDNDGVYHQVWNVSLMTVDEISTKAESCRAAKAKEIKDVRTALANGTTEVTLSSGVTCIVDLNIASRSNMHQAYDNGANSGFSPEDTMMWKMGDNTFMELSYNDLNEIGQQMSIYLNDLFQNEATKLEEIETCNDDIACIYGVSW